MKITQSRNIIHIFFSDLARLVLSDSKWAHYCEMIVNNIEIECVIEIYVRKEITVRLNIC